jgi:hypothetical protein
MPATITIDAATRRRGDRDRIAVGGGASRLSVTSSVARQRVPSGM